MPFFNQIILFTLTQTKLTNIYDVKEIIKDVEHPHRFYS